MPKYDKNIVLVRHGRPDYQHEHPRFSGDGTDLPLCETGRRQAEYAAELLRTTVFDDAYVSPMLRACQTAEPIMRGRNIGLTIVPALHEIDPGDFDGLTMDEARRKNADFFAARDLDLFGTRLPGGESFEDLEKRVVPAFEKIMDECCGNSLVVCHAGVIRVLLRYILGYPKNDLFKLDITYCGISVVSQNAKRRCIRAINLTDPEQILERK